VAILRDAVLRTAPQDEVYNGSTGKIRKYFAGRHAEASNWIASIRTNVDTIGKKQYHALERGDPR
jgi:hypothetical protein